MPLPKGALAELVAQDGALVAALRAGVPGLQAVYRYGGAGTAQVRDDSDIDLAVLAAAPLDYAMHRRLAVELTRLTGKDVDLNHMQGLPVTLRVPIVTGGVRLFARDLAAAEECDLRVLADHAYLNEARRAILDDVRAQGSIHG